MRKFLLVLTFFFCIIIVSAQSDISKVEKPIPLENKKWALCFGINPFLYNNSITSNNLMTIVVKILKNEKTAYRLKVALNYFSKKDEYNTFPYVGYDSLKTPSVIKASSMNISCGAGIQKWVGKGNFKGYYGADLMIGFGNSYDSTFAYLNPLVPVNGVGAFQLTQNKSGNIFGYGINGFLGCEYFFNPKVALSAEYVWGVSFTNSDPFEITHKEVNSTRTAIITSTEKGEKNSEFNNGVGNNVTPNTKNGSGSGSIVLSFYF